MSIRNLPIYLVILSVIGLAFGVGYISYPLMHGAPEAVIAPPVDILPSDQPAGQSMGAYWDAWQILDRDFFGEKPDATARTYGAIRGMVASFNDPYTYFVEPQPRELERDELAGRFGGIGANIELSDDGYLLRPVPGLPAAEAGVLDGDLLLMVDNHAITRTMSLDEIATLVRGPIDSVVTLVVRRTPADGGRAEELTLSITRAEMQTPSVEWRLLEDTDSGTVGYIIHTLFTERSVEEMKQALTELQEQGATRYILDMRGNRGGLVSTAVAIADLWLDEGVIFVEQKADGSETVQEATAGMMVDAPLVVIVDGGSASAAEIVAGALQDHGRATLVGEKTFGKGSVQLIHELSDQSSLHVTNAQWLTPNRRPISGNGLEPDVPIVAGSDPLPEAIAVVEAATVAQAGTTPTAQAGN
ncbi:MAG: S41 family peptidase [Caldilineaceae bacterium]|nr:S41 family peptidase [Caldilineaceae bacterium]